jgi:itaconate CoA-transferase
MSPLDSCVVISVEQAVAAPFCTARLADAGARVIKIERQEGDFARGYDDAANGMSSYFVWLNRGKESVVLDLGADSGRAQLAALLKSTDVFVQNLKPGSLSRLGFSVERMRADFPRLIYCSISGYGESGPLAQRKAYDLLIQAESGLASITGSPDEPARVGISVVDIATGATAYAAILEALIERGVSGKGADIQVSMFGVMADWLTVPLLHAEAGRAPRRIGLAHPSIAPYGVFSSKDGCQILIAIQNEREWQMFCTHVLRDAGEMTEAHFATNIARVEHRAEVDAHVAAITSSLTRDALIERLVAADTAFAEVNDLHALSRHPHMQRIAVNTSIGPVSYPAPGVSIDGRVHGAGTHVPDLGAHTSRVLAEIEAAGNMGHSATRSHNEFSR